MEKLAAWILREPASLEGLRTFFFFFVARILSWLLSDGTEDMEIIGC